MIPLLTDPFFGAMAVCIMFGLSFAGVLSLIVMPVLYAIFFRRPRTDSGGSEFLIAEPVGEKPMSRAGSAGTPAAALPYVSTGHLPPAETVAALVAEAHARFKADADGKNSQVYPALARVPSDLFGICVVGTNGTVYAAGDAER